MNYDPIHDSFTESASKETISSNITSNVSNSLTDMTSQPDTSPTRKALSISSLVDSTGGDIGTVNSNDIDDTAEVDNEAEEEMELDGDVDGDTSNTFSKRKVGNKGKKASSALPKGIRHLKKSDGEPFWRRDIQYDFLRELFDDENAVFTNYFPYCDIPAAKNDPNLTFSELYIRTLAESGKCSKILKERLLKDNEMGKSVGKVCLLVNAGRMNTTINFVPEMRSSLRTYHSIPSLQADPVYGGSKPLQDTPRLKSILKAVCDGEESKTLDDILDNPKSNKPNTNAIQLIFLLSGNIKGIKYHHEGTAESNNNFMEFFLNARIHPKNRAKRFLWLMYTYLETSFQPDELANNPFNPNTIPEIEYIESDAFDDFDKDTDFEIEYSEKMYRTRLGYLADEEHNNNPKRGNKSKKDREPEEPEETSYTEDVGENRSEQDDSDQAQEVSDSKKRAVVVDDNKSRKRKGKRNPVLHNTVVSSPLTKNVITFSLDNVKKNSNVADVISEEAKEVTEHPVEIREKSSDITDEYSTNNIDQIEFPIKGLDVILKQYLNSNIAPITPDSSVSIATRQNIIAKSRQVIRQIRNSSKSSGVAFNKKVDMLVDWIFRYFQYKKSTANGLLGIEWEAIRYDLINGLESYLYQQFGKTIGNQKFHQPSSKKGDSISNNIVAGQMDLASIEKVGFGYVATHDFSRGSEMELFMLDLISLCNDWVANNVETSDVEVIKFNLADETITFNGNQ